MSYQPENLAEEKPEEDIVQLRPISDPEACKIPIIRPRIATLPRNGQIDLVLQEHWPDTATDFVASAVDPNDFTDENDAVAMNSDREVGLLGHWHVYFAKKYF